MVQNELGATKWLLTFDAVLDILQVAQGNPHQTRVEHQFILVCRPHELRGQVEKEYAGVTCGNLVVTDPRITKATNHHLVAAIQKNITIDYGLPFQVAPHPDL